MIMFANGCRLSAIECQGPGTAVEHHNLVMNWQVSVKKKK